MKTGIIIPCFNEEKRINKDAYLKFIRENNQEYHLCFVNDGSKDNTFKVLQEMKSEASQNISIVDIKKNVGKATAVRAGVRYLYNKKEIAFIGFMDADLSTDFRDFKDLVKTLKSDDDLSVVFGSRNLGGENIERNFVRNILSCIVKKAVNMVLGLPIRDTQCGAKVFSRSIVPVAYQDKFVSRWLFDVEIFLRLKKYLGKENVMKHIAEQPLMRWVHVDDSKLGLKDSLEIPARLFHIWTSYNVLNRWSITSQLAEPTIAINFDASTEVAMAA